MALISVLGAGAVLMIGERIAQYRSWHRLDRDRSGQ